MENKKIVKQFISNLISDNEKAFQVIAENVEAFWPGSGMPSLKGKKELLNFFEVNGPEKVLKRELIDIVYEGDIVVGHGNLETEKNGKKEKSHFADFYKIENGNIVSIISYMVLENKN